MKINNKSNKHINSGHKFLKNLNFFIKLALLILAVWSVIGSYYAEYRWGMNPCPLCLMQRWMAVSIVVWMMVQYIISRWYSGRLLMILASISSLLGVFFAARQLWLMSQPQTEAAVCMPGLETVIAYLSWPALCKALFWGTSDCGHAAPKCLGLSMPTWSLIVFSMMLLFSCMSVYINFYLNRNK